MNKVIGIDLGTTNSCVAVVESGGVTVIQNSEGLKTTPSVIAFNDEGEKLIGQIAKRQSTTNPKKTIHSIKRLLGNTFDSSSVQEEINNLSYKIIEAKNNTIQIEIGDKKISPTEISGFIIQNMKVIAEDYLGEKVTQAVITVPSLFPSFFNP